MAQIPEKNGHKRSRGRPQKYDEPTGRIGCRLPQSVIDWLDAQPASRTETVLAAIDCLRRAALKRSRRNAQ